MIIVPGPPALQETRHSRELNRRVEEAIRDYRRDHPELTEADVRTALMQSTPGGEPGYIVRRRKAAAVGVAAAAVGAFTAVAGGGGKFTGQTWILVCAVLLVVGALAFAAIRLARRD